MFRQSYAVGVVFIVCILFTLIYFKHPAALAVLKERLEFTDSQMTNVIMILDVLLGVIFNIYLLNESKKEKNRCSFSFFIEEDVLSIENYIGFPTEIHNAYIYSCRGSGGTTETDCVSVIIPFKEDGIYSIGIPITVKVSTALVGVCMVFSGLGICVSNDAAAREGSSFKYKKHGIFAKILRPVTEKQTYLLRLKLLCDYDMERRLQNSRISLSFRISLFDDKRKSHCCKFYIKIQNVDGKSNLLSVLPRWRCF